MKMYIYKDCMKITNESGVVMSIGGDDNLRGDGKKDRLTVLFHAPGFVSHDLKAPIFEKEHAEDGSISIWCDPEKLLKCLAAHLKYELKKNEKAQGA